MSCPRGRQDGFTLVEAAVVLALLGVVGAAVFSLIGWSVQVQARYEAAHMQQESADMALEQIARLLRTAGADGKPALWKGTRHSLDLCGIPWAGRAVRASVTLEQGTLVLTGFEEGCLRYDNLTAPVPLVPGVRFAQVQFDYVTPEGEVEYCSQTSSPPCTAVTGVVVSVTPAGAPTETKLFVALRNPGGP